MTKEEVERRLRHARTQYWACMAWTGRPGYAQRANNLQAAGFFIVLASKYHAMLVKLEDGRQHH